MSAMNPQHRTQRARTGSMLLLGLTSVILLLGQNRISFAQRTGPLEMMAVNFPATGSGQINIGEGPQQLGNTGLTPIPFNKS